MQNENNHLVRFVEKGFNRNDNSSIDHEYIDSLLTIRLQREDGTSFFLGNEYKEEFFHGRSPYLKYLNNNQ